jgi:hypothetical protein
MSSKKALINEGVRSARFRLDGARLVFACVKRSSMRKVSRYDAIVCGLAFDWATSRVAKKPSNNGARLAGFIKRPLSSGTRLLQPPRPAIPVCSSDTST